MRRYVYILADRSGCWATMRSRPIPRRVRGVKVRYIGTYQSDIAAWRAFEAAQWVAKIAQHLIFPELHRRQPR